MFNASLKIKMLFVGLAGVVLVGLIALSSIYLLVRDINDFNHLMDKDVAFLNDLNSSVLQYKKQIQEWKNTLLRGHNSDDRDKYWSRFVEYQAELQKDVLELSQSEIPADVKASLVEFLTIHKKIFPRYNDAYNTFKTNGGDFRKADNDVRGLDRETTEMLEMASVSFAAAVKRDSEASVSHAMAVAVGESVFLVVSALIVAALSWYLSRVFVTSPLQHLIHGVSELAAGRFNFKVNYQHEDELGELANALRALQDNLARSTDAITDAMRHMSEADDKLESVSVSIQAGTQQQSSRTDQMASAMTEMAATSREVAQHTSEAARASKDAEEAAIKGEKIMQFAINTMGQMREHISSTTDVIRDLENKTTEVGTVLDVIGGIAEQTNLLALNAAIEAARAGEQGRGFAVVADEVRTLAKRTQESTEEINQIIVSVQNGAQAAVKAIETGRDQSDESVKKVNEAGDALSAIRHAVDKIAEVNQFIASASQEQAHVSEEITRSVSEIAEVAEVVASQANEVLTSTNNIRNTRKQLENTVGRLRSR